MDPNDLVKITDDLKHIHDDMMQLVGIVLIMGFVIICWMPSSCKYKDKK
jgi:hypothetical protein